MYQTLIEPHELEPHLSDPAWVIIDCRFRLNDPEAGEEAYLAGHIPGAIYAHLDRDLSGPPVTDRGRHPLPTPAEMTKLFSRWGIRENSQVVVYDDARGVFASRLWWMLRYMNHKNAAVLNGGLHAWLAAGYTTALGHEQKKVVVFTGEPRRDRLVIIDEVERSPLLIDSRSPERYRGEEEPLDPRAGHIPGAVNHFYGNNYGEDGRFLTASELQERLAYLFTTTDPEEAVFYCGSGVSACVNLLAAVHAGLGEPRLFVGSWSEWSQDEKRPAAVG